MSRCFPFPPPGYMRNGSRSEALIESIKLRKEMERAKKDRKEKKDKKREKKEKRKEKKERKQKEGTTSHASDDNGKKFKHINEIKEIKPNGMLQKGEDCENDQLERSGITEELDQPVSSLEPCCLSDSTQSSKRKRSDLQSNHDHGSTIRIRLPMRKHREPEESKSQLKYEVGSSSGSVGNADPLTRDTVGRNHQLQCLTNTETKQVLGGYSDCKALQNNLVHGDAITMVTNKLEDESQGVAALYKSLLQIPPLTCDGFDSVDEDWLFRSEWTGARPVSKKLKSDSDILQCSKSLWPRAQYLPEVEVYALPYAVPF